MENNEKLSIGFKILLSILLGYLAIKIVSRLSKFIDVITFNNDDQEQAEKALNSEPFKFFNPNFGFDLIIKKYGTLQNYFNSISFTTTKATIIAQNILNSYGFVNDQEQKIYLAFSEIPTQAALSLVSNQFIVLYPSGGGLLNFIDFLDGNELNNIKKILEKKPIL